MQTDEKLEVLKVSWDIEGCGKMTAIITNNRLTEASFHPINPDLSPGLETNNWDLLLGIHKAVGELKAHMEQAPRAMPEVIREILPETDETPEVKDKLAERIEELTND